MSYSLDVVANTPFSKEFIDSKHFFKEKLLHDNPTGHDLKMLVDNYIFALQQSDFDEKSFLGKNSLKLFELIYQNYDKDGILKLPSNEIQLQGIIRFYYHYIMDYLTKTN